MTDRDEASQAVNGKAVLDGTLWNKDGGLEKVQHWERRHRYLKAVHISTSVK